MEEKIKIAQFIDAYYPVVDGVVTLVDNYARRMNNDESSCIVIAPKAIGQDDSTREYPILRCGSISLKRDLYGLPLPRLDSRFVSRIKKMELDICHSHAPMFIGRYGIALAKKRKVPSVMTFHSKFYDHIIKTVKFDILAKVPMLFCLDSYNHADFVWAVSKESGEVLKEYGYKGEFDVVNNGCEMDYYEFDQLEKTAFDSRYKIKKEDAVFIFVGQIINHKNIKFSIDALKICKQKGLKFKFFLAGEGYNFNDIVSYAKLQDLSEECIFLGSVKDRELLSKFYSRGDLFLFPSVYDNAPLVVMEAARCFCPPIVMKDSTTSEKIQHGINGFITTEDSHFYADTIISAMADREKLFDIAQTAKETIGKSFDEVAVEVFDRYKECIKLYKKRNKLV